MILPGWLVWVGGVAVAAVALVALGFAALMIGIARFGRHHAEGTADVAVVLGARVIDGRASPVLEQRVLHAVELWRTGRVRRILLAGGRAADWGISEAEAAQRVALDNGVPPDVLLTETDSRTTWENMTHAARILDREGLVHVMIVSDPPHMFRAMAMAQAAGLAALPAPTPTTRYRSPAKRWLFLFREARGYLRFRGLL